MKRSSTILVTGGAGYVGSALVPRLLERGHHVRVLDLFWYGRDVFPGLEEHPRLERIEGDIRDAATVERALGQGGGLDKKAAGEEASTKKTASEKTATVDAVIHLACISNDPSFELDPGLGKSINLDAFPGLVEAALKAGVGRFIYASSSSIYGVKEEPRVQEDAEPEPLTDYSRFKLECERLLLEACHGEEMVPVIVRPATVCGYAPRLRLDLTVNILTAHALEKGVIRVFGGRQLRPNLHIQDMVAAYEIFLDAPSELVRNEAFNVGYQNHAVGAIAEKVQAVLTTEGQGARDVEIRVEPNDDLRSYHIDSSKVARHLGFAPRFGLEDAIQGLADAHRRGLLIDPLNNPAYHNIRRMREILAAES